MSDLTDALAHGVRAYWPDSVHVDGEAWQAVSAAARRVAEAQPIKWCEEHGSKGSERRCEWSMRYHYAKRYCRMVRKLLVDPAEQT